MRRKRLNHYADVVCKMFVGWRMGDDMEALSDLPDGTISINLLTGDAVHSEVGLLDLHIAKEIQAWLQQQGAKEGVDIEKLKSATLEVDVDTNKVATNKKKVLLFSFSCRSNLKTDTATYQGALTDEYHWYTRIIT
ncbi:hypothetical protein [Marinospirillum sp.]|uniref:hypothetical protein n=1 Tax=Marinospirillum sp. TaxID=2183934 RepID=UPI00384C43E3